MEINMGGFKMIRIQFVGILILSLLILPLRGQEAQNTRNDVSASGSHFYSLEGRHNIQLNVGLSSNFGVHNEISSGSITNSVKVEGFMGSIGYYYWISQYLSVGLNIGVMGSDVTTSTNLTGEYNQTSSVIPILFGFKIHPVTMMGKNTLRPYLSVLAGPFVGSVVENYACTRIENSVYTETSPGAHFGLGMDWSISNLFVLGMGAGYYYVSEFDNPIGDKTDYSSANFSFTFGILLGRTRAVKN
jgi:hypothetical protein